MAKPKLMSYEKWIKDTNVSVFIGLGTRKRSDALGAIDIYLKEFHDPTDGQREQWPKHLRSLDQVLDAWIKGKTTDKGEFQSMRDKTTVLKLQSEVKLARTLPDPQPWL